MNQPDDIDIRNHDETVAKHFLDRLRGLEGYGETAEIHRPRIFLHDLPIVLQIVDSEENIRRLLPVVEEMLDKGLIAMSDVNVIRVEKGRVEKGDNSS